MLGTQKKKYVIIETNISLCLSITFFLGGEQRVISYWSAESNELIRFLCTQSMMQVWVLIWSSNQGSPVASNPLSLFVCFYSMHYLHYSVFNLHILSTNWHWRWRWRFMNSWEFCIFPPITDIKSVMLTLYMNYMNES